MFLLPSGINGQPCLSSLESVGLSAVVLLLLDNQAVTAGWSVRSFCVTKDPPLHEDTTIFLYLFFYPPSFIFYVYFAVASQCPRRRAKPTPVEAILSRPCPEFTNHSPHTLSCHLLPKSFPRSLSPSRTRRIRR